MVKDDIYGYKGTYERLLATLDQFALQPDERRSGRLRGIYYCKNSKNLEYFRKMAVKLDSRDTSYIRRCKLFYTLRIICHATTKDLAECGPDDLDEIVAFAYTRLNKPKTKTDFIADIQFLWRQLLPEVDPQGRLDLTTTPYPVRHLKAKIDKSQEEERKDKLTWDEFMKLINYFSSHPSVQAFLITMFDGYGRPQETAFARIRSLKIFDGYGKIMISEHGKEGIGFLPLTLSFPYVMKWYSQHPFKSDPDAYLFLDEKKKQLHPDTVNDLLKKACAELGIGKHITCYSFKRNGITTDLANGVPPQDVKYKSRWTSMRPLNSYDMNTQEDAFQRDLTRKGLLTDTKGQHSTPKTKQCPFCSFAQIGFSEDTCPKCLRLVDSDKIREKMRSDDEGLEKVKEFLEQNSVGELFKLKEMVTQLQSQMRDIKSQRNTSAETI